MILPDVDKSCEIPSAHILKAFKATDSAFLSVTGSVWNYMDLFWI